LGLGLGLGLGPTPTPINIKKLQINEKINNKYIIIYFIK